MSKNKSTVRINTGHRGNPPEHTKYKQGQSGNVHGRPKGPATLAELFNRELHKVRSLNTGRKRVKVTAKQLMVRNLVESAAKGDKRALTELMELIAIHGEGLKLGKPETVTFAAAIEGPQGFRLNDPDLFFRRQDEALERYRRELREAQPMAMLLKRELDRKIDGTRAGKPAKIRMRDAIVARFLKDGTKGAASVLKTLLMIAPEKKAPVCPVSRIVERPSAEEKECFLKAREQARAEADELRAQLKAEREAEWEAKMRQWYGADWRSQ